MKKILLTVCALTLLAACSQDDNDSQQVEPSVKARRTVLVYVAAENNLDPFLDNNLAEMKKGSLALGDDQNLVVYVNRAQKKNPCYMARIRQGELVDTLFMPDELAADPAVLERILCETRERYPAQSYGLVLWGHCDGWVVQNSDDHPATRAFGASSGDRTKSIMDLYWMDIPQMAQAIAKGMGQDKLSFIFGECCEFMSLEIAYELRHLANYLIGSPGEIPDGGAPYDICVADLFLETDDFYRTLIDHYYDYWLAEYQKEENEWRYFNFDAGDLAGYSVPLSAIKCSELDQLATATSQVLGTMADKLSPTGSLNLDRALYYAAYISKQYDYDANSVLALNAAPADYLAWKASYDKAVVYARHTAHWFTIYSRLSTQMWSYFDQIPAEDCGTISMFFPSHKYEYITPNWNKAIQQFQWNDVIHWEQYGW